MSYVLKIHSGWHWMCFAQFLFSYYLFYVFDPLKVLKKIATSNVNHIYLKRHLSTHMVTLAQESDSIVKMAKRSKTQISAITKETVRLVVYNRVNRKQKPKEINLSG